MRLEPVEFGCGDRADVQAVDLRGVGQLAFPFFVVRDRGCDERRTDLLIRWEKLPIPFQAVRLGDGAGPGHHA